MTLEYHQTRGDLFALNLYHQFHRPVVWIVIALVSAFVIRIIHKFPGIGSENPSVFWSVPVVVLLMTAFYSGLIVVVAWIRVNRKGFVAMTGARRITLEREEIATESEDGRGTLRWSAVQKIVRTKKHLLIYVTPMNAFIIPKRELADPEEFDALYRQVCEWWKESAKNEKSSSITTEPSP